MNYGIYFDESNKLDQPNGAYSYYGALGVSLPTTDNLIREIDEINKKLKTKSELHFVNYTNSDHFGKYFNVLNFILDQEVKLNMMIVNKRDAVHVADKMGINLVKLRELFYVKIPERLFYGMTRKLDSGQHVHIVIDENSEYEKLELETKLAEQMNAHSAYRNKGYKVSTVKQESSENNIFLQLIDVFMGIVVFLLESQYKDSTLEKESITKMVKSDLVYRFLIHKNNLEKIHSKFILYKWEDENDQINRINLSEYTGEFIVHKTQYDIKEMNRLSKLRLTYPDETTKFYREKMGYKNRQLNVLMGYIDELDGNGRNIYYMNNK